MTLSSERVRHRLFGYEPLPELVGLASLTDPGPDVTAVIDVPVVGARGDGKTQFIIHAIRALHAHAPALEGDEQRLNQDAMRLVLDPRARRPDATPPGAVPHFTFRIRGAGLLKRLGFGAALGLALRAGRVGGWLLLAAAACAAAIVATVLGEPRWAVLSVCTALLCGSAAARRVKSRIARYGDLEIVFWDVAGEQVYSQTAADYYAFLAHLVAARRARADELGRAYAFAPVLICNPLALGTEVEGSPYERLRELVPIIAAIDRDTPRALVAVNRWSVVDPICQRGALRDEVVAVTSNGEHEQRVVREQVRTFCLDAEDGRDGDVEISYLRYDTAMRASVDVDEDAGALAYRFDEGTGAFGGRARHVFLSWVVRLVRWPRSAPRARAATAPATVALPAPAAPPEIWARPTTTYAPDAGSS